MSHAGPRRNGPTVAVGALPMTTANTTTDDVSPDHPDEPPEDVRWLGVDNEEGVIELTFERPAIEWMELEAEERGQSITEWIKSRVWTDLNQDLGERHGPTRNPEVDLPEDFAVRCRLYNELQQAHGGDASLDEIVFNHMKLNPVWTLDGEPLGSDRREDEPEAVTDGGVDTGQKPDWVKVDDETWARIQRELDLDDVVIHADVELPRETYDVIQERVDAYDADFADIAIEFLLHEYRFTVNGEEVDRTAGYDADA